jgi:hypothetical protein
VQTNVAGQGIVKLWAPWRGGVMRLVISPLALMPCSAVRRPGLGLPSAWFSPLKDSFVASIRAISKPVSGRQPV